MHTLDSFTCAFLTLKSAQTSGHGGWSLTKHDPQSGRPTG